MKYKKEFEDYQRLFKKSLKKRFKCVVDLKVDYDEFEQILDLESVLGVFNVTLYWDVNIAIKENETLMGIAALGKSIFQFMFNRSAIPWINLEKAKENED